MAANGQLPASALAPIPGGHLARGGPAESWNAYCADVHRRTGRTPLPNGPDSSYRPLARQRYYKAYWCGRGHCENAATPGTSNHGLGWALDLPPWVVADLRSHGASFGWQKQWSDAPWEPWHHKYAPGHFHGRAPTPADPLTTRERRLVGELAGIRARAAKRGKWTKAELARARSIKAWLLAQSVRIRDEAHRKGSGGWAAAHRRARYRILRAAYSR